MLRWIWKIKIRNLVNQGGKIQWDFLDGTAGAAAVAGVAAAAGVAAVAAAGAKNSHKPKSHYH